MPTEHVAKTDRHATFYLAEGPEDGFPIIFVHGWPELSISWRWQLPTFAALGFRAIAPDMRGYGRSSTYDRQDAYGLEAIVADMIELLDSLGRERAMWVGHDLGVSVICALAQHHPERCAALANLCVPYIPEGLSVEAVLPYVNRDLYPIDEFPVGQWDYQMYYRENFDAAVAQFDANPKATVCALFRAGSPKILTMRAHTAAVRADGGWFHGEPIRERPRDERVISEADEAAYAAALTRNGFFGPDSWYMNWEANRAYAESAKENWRLDMPSLFIHGAYEAVCDTLRSDLAEPMRELCPNLSETTIESGHWMAQERPREVNAAIARWLALEAPEVWGVR